MVPLVNLGGLQSEVNDWLNENNNKIEVVSRHIAVAPGTNSLGNTFVNCTVLIFYRNIPCKK